MKLVNIMLSLPAGRKAMHRPKTFPVNVYIVNIKQLFALGLPQGCLRA